MSAQYMDGKETAKAVRREVKEAVAGLKERGISPGLAAVLVGDNPASEVYVSMKQKACAQAGIASTLHRLPPTASTEDVTELLRGLNADESVHGILLQLPLPKGVDTQAAINAIAPEKDVDGVTSLSFGKLVLGQETFVSATAGGMMELLRRYDIPVAGKRAVVVGRSNIVGKPMALLLLHADATVTICHSKTRDLPALCRDADILVAALNQPEMLDKDYVKPGAVVLDAGYSRPKDRTGDVGDVNTASAAEVAAWITPVPGGVGPMTIATLLQNTLRAATNSAR
jgi:methylenetetrahydrofolate dehydrogenase (NADP+)/methenyltetrahydrofolate cyclohydrolase